MNGRGRLVARLLYSFSHGHSLSGMCACAVMLMQPFIHVNASVARFRSNRAPCWETPSPGSAAGTPARRIGPFCNQPQLPLYTAVAFGTVNGNVLDRNPKLGQQLPELSLGEVVPVIKTSNVQTFIGRRHVFDGVMPDAKGVTQGKTALVSEKQRPSYVGVVIHYQHTVPRPTGGRRVRPRKIDEDLLQCPPRLDLRLPGNGASDPLRLDTAVAASPGTRYLDPRPLRGLTCVGVVGVAKGDT